jgi:hypothetical protein
MTLQPVPWKVPFLFLYNSLDSGQFPFFLEFTVKIN